MALSHVNNAATYTSVLYDIVLHVFGPSSRICFFRTKNTDITDPVAQGPYSEVSRPTAAVDQATIRNLDRRLQSLEQQMRTVRQAVLQQRNNRGSGSQNQGSRVWYVLTFAGWVMVPLVVVFMFHYRKTAH